MTLPHSITTAEQLRAAGDIGPCELVRGELIMMAPAGEEHGGVAHTLGRHLGNYVADRSLGRVYAAETGFLIARNPDTVRAPDVSFVRQDRLAPRPRQGFGEIVPDLVAEVLSPGDRAIEVLD
jgi:Uma2 family endonuclease